MTSQKGKISLLIILLAVAILIGYLVYQSFSPWKIYLNPYLGFAFLYPKQWQVNTFQYSKDPNRGITLETGPKEKLDREVFNLYDSNPPLYINCQEDPKLQTKEVQVGNGKATVSYVIGNNYQYGCVIPKVRTLTGKEFWVEFKFFNKERENKALEVLKTIRGLKIISYSTPSDETANWKAYENSQGGFTFKYPVDWQIEEVKPQKFSEDIALLKTNTLTGMQPNPSQILEENYRISIALLLNPDEKIFREVYDHSALSFGQGFSNTPINITKGSINNLTTYETTSIFTWNGAFGTFFESPDLNEYIAFILTPYKKDSPYKNQSDIRLTLNQILSTFRFLP